LGDIQSTGGTLSGFGGTGQGYTALFTSNQNIETKTITVPAGSFTDANGCPNQQGTFNLQAVEGPSVTIQGPPVVCPTITVPITFTLSQPSINFVLTDIQVSFGSITNFVDVSSTFYTADANINQEGVFVITIPQGSFTNEADCGNIEAVFSINSTNDPYTIDITATQPGPYCDVSLIPLLFTFEQPTNEFDVGDINITSDPLIAPPDTPFITGITPVPSTNNYTATLNVPGTPDPSGTIITVEIPNAQILSIYGCLNSIAFIELEVFKSPTISIGVIPDPPGPGPYPLTANISPNDPTTNLIVTDFDVSGGFLTEFTVVNPKRYTFKFNNNGPGPKSITVPAGTFTDSVTGCPNQELVFSFIAPP
jgi:hypothetical protein